MTIKEKKKRRSRDANAYFWEFLDQLATKMQIGKTELYRELIRDIGGVSTIICVKSEAAADALIDGWKHNGIEVVRGEGKKANWRDARTSCSTTVPQHTTQSRCRVLLIG